MLKATFALSVLLAMACSPEKEDPNVEATEASRFVDATLEAVDAESFAEGWTPTVVPLPHFDSEPVTGSSDACLDYRALLDAMRSARVRNLFAEAGMELRLRKSGRFGIAVLALSVHSDRSSATQYLDAFFAAESSSAHRTCVEETTSDSLGLRMSPATPAVQGPDKRYASSILVRFQSRHDTQIERYGWTRGNIALILGITADDGIFDDFDLPSAIDATNDAIDSAVK